MSVTETIKSIVSEKVDVSKLNDDTHLSSLGLDSLDLAEIMISIEETLGVEFSSGEILKLKTFKDVVELVESKTK